MNFKKFVNLYTGLVIGIIIILSGMALMSFNHAVTPINKPVYFGTVDVTYNNTSRIQMDISPIQINAGDYFDIILVDEHKTHVGTVIVIGGVLTYDLPAEYCLNNEDFSIYNAIYPDKFGMFRTNVIYPVNPDVNNTNDTNSTVDPTINDTNNTVDILNHIGDNLTDIGESLPVTGNSAVLLGLLACIVGILTIKR
ncbi:MAG: hypothetical protein CfClM3_0577 [Methanobrevibacter sp. CfCl-M3]